MPNAPVSEIDTLAEELFTKMQAYLPDLNRKKLNAVYTFAARAHEGQLRRSGEPYIIHPLRTALTLTNLHVDEETIMAALLHDVPEDTGVSIAEIEGHFGKTIAYLVDGITKLMKVHYQERMEQRHIESLKKLFFHSAQDLRVIVIKLADRLDNMRSLRFIAAEKKRYRIARETLEIYVPIANLLGMGEIRAELENLCFEHLYHADYTALKNQLEETQEQRNFILQEMIHLTKKELKKNGMEAEIMGRPKTYYSIYRKLQTKQTLANIEDLMAIRVIVPTRQDCYETLGIIHHLFKPKTGHIKDYIAVPKPNGYQSLHTTVFGLSGSSVELQIRTRYMHLEAEYGVAAHYFYKYSEEGELTDIMRQRSTWVQRILELHKEQKDNNHFLEHLKVDIFQDRIFVFSPKGDVIDLPRGACCLDFAYAIHPDVGHHAIKADVNGIVYPVSTVLNTGDTVRIITNKEVEPQREWLNWVKTTLAITKIQEYLKRFPFSKKIEIGKEALKKELDRIGKTLPALLSRKNVTLLRQKLKKTMLDEIFSAIGEGEINPGRILELLGEKKIQTPQGPMKVNLRIAGSNRNNEFREIIVTLNALHIQILKISIDSPWYLREDRCRLTVMVKNYAELIQIFEGLEKLEGISKISRVFLRRTIWFFAASIATGLLWLSHPFIIHILLSRWPYASLLSDAIIAGGGLMLLILTMYAKKMTGQSFPELTMASYYWHFIYGSTTLALFIIAGEILTFDLQFRWIFMLALIIGIYTLLTISFFRARRQNARYTPVGLIDVQKKRGI